MLNFRTASTLVAKPLPWRVDSITVHFDGRSDKWRRNVNGSRFGSLISDVSVILIHYCMIDLKLADDRVTLRAIERELVGWSAISRPHRGYG